MTVDTAVPGGDVSAPARKFNLKVLLMIILGGLWLVNFTYYIIRTGTSMTRLDYYFFANFLFCPLLLWTGMLLCALRKKLPAVILLSTYVVLSLAGDVYGIVSYLSSPFSVSPAEFFTADTVISYLISLLTYALVLLYATAGWRRRDSLAWMLAYLGLCLCSHLLEVVRSHLYAYPEGSLMQIVNAMTLPDFLTTALVNFVSTAFFAIGFSPDKWYRRKKNG